jgi:hypothetical protein
MIRGTAVVFPLGIMIGLALIFGILAWAERWSRGR